MADKNSKRVFRVQLEKDTMVFSAAHFITFNGNICESIHGHNYAVKAEVVGPLDENGYVCDFIALRDGLAKIVATICLLYTSPSPRDGLLSRMPSSA